MMKPTMAVARRIVAILFCIAVPLAAQFQAPLEAESPEEFDLYLTVEGAQDAAAVVKRSEAFRGRWPQSNLLPRVWEMRFLALQKLGKPAEARTAGEEALRLAPGNLTVRAGLAVQLASEDGTAADGHARAVLEELDRAKIRRAVPLEKYREVAAKLRGQARVALGLVLYRRGDMAGALRELETADRLAPEPALSYRLGRLYGALGRTEEARKRLAEAANAPDPELAERGRRALAELR
jgi:tetratricopeptide (TPR) repeat protein